MIPRFLHQTWRDREPPADMARLALTWRRMNPGWHHQLWTDADARWLIARCAPWFLSIYDGYREPIMRVDAFRIFLMLHVGGVYVDLDYECLRPIDDLLKGAEAVVALEPDEHQQEAIVRQSGLSRVVSNAFLASAPGHPFWAHVIDRLVQERKRPGPLDATGPFLLTRALDDWRGAEPVTLAPTHAVNPAPKRAVWAGALADPAARDRLRAEGAFAVHHWMGTWVHSHDVEGADIGSRVRIHLVRRGRAGWTRRLSRRAWSRAEKNPPLVSALMVTKDRPALAMCSIECFRRQTWPESELVILDDGTDGTLAEAVRRIGDPRIRHVRLPPEGLPLGALRNRAVAEARGGYVCQWDDDDLSHPERIAIQVAALRRLKADACVLHRETIWWTAGGRVALSPRRLWESSLLAKRTSLPPYPAIRRGEDTPVVEVLASAGRVAVVDEPRLQVYVVHGRNTFPASHFDVHWQAATVRHEGPAALAWVRAHSSSLPLEQVLAAVDPAPEAPATPRGPQVLVPRPDAPPEVLLLVPVKDAATYLDGFLESLRSLDWPRERLSIGFLESDSRDGTYERLLDLRPDLEATFRQVSLWKQDFGFHPSVPRWNSEIQRERRTILARSRNELLRRTLAPEHEWVLWIDVDVAEWPADLIQRLLAPGKDVVVPHVVSARNGDTFDLNTWRLHPDARGIDWRPWLVDGLLQPPCGLGRQYLGELEDHVLVEVDSVGGAVLLVRADLHRAGAVFPEEPVEGLIETEGLGVLVRERGSACFGLPRLRVVHS